LKEKIQKDGSHAQTFHVFSVFPKLDVLKNKKKKLKKKKFKNFFFTIFEGKKIKSHVKNGNNRCKNKQPNISF
jgi:hypothetical protein